MLGSVVGIALLLAGCAGGGDGSAGPPAGGAPAEPVLGSAQPQLSLELPEGGGPAVGVGPLSSGIDVSPILADGAARRTRIGLLLPLSGPKAPVGTALLNAAQLALFDARQTEVGLIVRDTKGTPAGAQAAAQSALAEGAALLVGPFFATSVAAAAPQARARQVAVIAFSNDPAVAGNGV